MNSPLETLVREVIKMPLGLKFALCAGTVYEAKYRLGGWIYCCGIVQHKYYLS